MLQNYQRLANLLRSQQDALQKDDSAKLASLLPLIEEYSKRVFLKPDHPADSTLLVEEILQLAKQNQQAYLRRRESLTKMQSQLQTASRYLQQMRRNHLPSHSRASWTG